jgi:hypothetical protein
MPLNALNVVVEIKFNGPRTLRSCIELQLVKQKSPNLVILSGIVFGGLLFIISDDNCVAPLNALVPIVVELNKSDNVDIPDPENADVPILVKFPRVDMNFNDEQLLNALFPMLDILLGSVFGGPSFIVNIDRVLAPANVFVVIDRNVELNRRYKDEIPDPENADVPILVKLPIVDINFNDEQPLNAENPILDIVIGRVFGGLSFIVKLDRLLALKNRLV